MKKSEDSLAAVECHDTPLITEKRIAVTHLVRCIEGFICKFVVGEHYVFHAHEHQRKMRSIYTINSYTTVKDATNPVNNRAHVEYAVTA